MTVTYKTDADHIAPAPTGADGSNDRTSGMQLATANGTIGNDTVPAALPGQSIGVAADSTYFTQVITP
jgi:hypothetical protein